jgi:outer membrane protein OmpA-like peptidoglycan-associated protein
MSRTRGTKSFAAAAVIGLFVAHTATAQETKNLPMDATAHFIYFPTGGHALDDKDQAQLKDVAGMMQSTPSFVATIIGKADTVGSVDFNERLSRRRVNERLEDCLGATTRFHRTGCRCAGPASVCHS